MHQKKNQSGKAVYLEWVHGYAHYVVAMKKMVWAPTTRDVRIDVKNRDDGQTRLMIACRLSSVELTKVCLGLVTNIFGNRRRWAMCCRLYAGVGEICVFNKTYVWRCEWGVHCSSGIGNLGNHHYIKGIALKGYFMSIGCQVFWWSIGCIEIPLMFSCYFLRLCCYHSLLWLLLL